MEMIEKGKRFAFPEVAARKKLGLEPYSDAWRIARIEFLNGGYLCEGGPVRIKRNGEPAWPKVSKLDRVIITEKDRVDAENAYEAESGFCSDCFGTTEKVVGWNHSHGKMLRTCRKCRGWGVPQKC